MPWTYGGNPGTATTAQRRDAVRLLTKDVTSGSQQLQDAEVAFFLTQNNNGIYRAASDACRQMAARVAKSQSVGDLSISGLGDAYLLLAKDYELRADMQSVPFAGGISIGDKITEQLNPDRVPPAFTRGRVINSTGAEVLLLDTLGLFSS